MPYRACCGLAASPPKADIVRDIRLASILFFFFFFVYSLLVCDLWRS